MCWTSLDTIKDVLFTGPVETWGKIQNPCRIQTKSSDAIPCISLSVALERITGFYSLDEIICVYLLRCCNSWNLSSDWLVDSKGVNLMECRKDWVWFWGVTTSVFAFVAFLATGHELLLRDSEAAFYRNIPQKNTKWYGLQGSCMQTFDMHDMKQRRFVFLAGCTCPLQ